MDTSTQEIPVDLPSIAAIQKQMYRRWLPHYASLVLKLVPFSSLIGLGLHWLIVWFQPERANISPWLLPITFGLGALVICLWTLPAMLRLDFQISRRLAAMAQRIRAGETVYASEVEKWTD